MFLNYNKIISYIIKSLFIVQILKCVILFKFNKKKKIIIIGCLCLLDLIFQVLTIYEVYWVAFLNL